MAAFPDTTTLPESRTDLESLIEAAIARLDEIDQDPDFEPTLGAPEADAMGTEAFFGHFAGPRRSTALSQARWAAGGTDDREFACEDEGAQCDDEGDNTDREPDEPDEPDYWPSACGPIALVAVRP